MTPNQKFMWGIGRICIQPQLSGAQTTRVSGPFNPQSPLLTIKGEICFRASVGTDARPRVSELFTDQCWPSQIVRKHICVASIYIWAIKDFN